MDAEHYAAARLVEREEMKLDWWAGRVNEYLHYVEVLFTPDLIIVGGGISKRFKDFKKHLSTRAELVPAKLRNNAGIVGAALAAHEELE
jgi:polyphosphate glucokinase